MQRARTLRAFERLADVTDDNPEGVRQFVVAYGALTLCAAHLAPLFHHLADPLAPVCANMAREHPIDVYRNAARALRATRRLGQALRTLAAKDDLYLDTRKQSTWRELVQSCNLEKEWFALVGDRSRELLGPYAHLLARRSGIRNARVVVAASAGWWLSHGRTMPHIHWDKQSAPILTYRDPVPREDGQPMLWGELALALWEAIQRPSGVRLGVCRNPDCGNPFEYGTRRGQPPQYCAACQGRARNRLKQSAWRERERARKAGLAPLRKR